MEDNFLIFYSNPGREELSRPSLPRASITFQPFTFVKSFGQMTPGSGLFCHEDMECAALPK
jgi:hypothetical protein